MTERLPPLWVDDCACRLPLCEPSAAALLSALLDPHGDRSLGTLAEALSLDPALALWGAYHHAAHSSGVNRPNIEELAVWLATHRGAILRASSDPGRAEHATTGAAASVAPLTPAERKRIAAAATASVAAAEQAARKTKTLADPKYLVALLNDASSWLVAGGCRAEAVAALPGWLGATSGKSAARGIGEQRAAPRHVVKKPLKSSAARRGRAAAARQRWLVPAGFAATHFDVVAVKLARLVDLETQFDERLEEEKLAALAEFAAGAGHEINNPLAVISGRAQLFLRGESDPERRWELAVINTQARRVHEMIADLMLFARPPRPRLAECSVAEVVSAVVQELSPRAADTGITLESDGMAEMPAIQADPTQLKIALRAVCENAFDALDAGGRIEIAVQLRPPIADSLHVSSSAARVDGKATNPPPFQGGARGGSNGSAPIAGNQTKRSGIQEASYYDTAELQTAPAIAIIVRDNGPGMPQEVRRHAFDPFFSGRGAGRGLGLGLSKCWRIITGHQGRVEIDSTDSGTTVTMVLPSVSTAIAK